VTAPGDDQAAVIGFLSDPATYGGAPVERLSTHGAHIFLAGDRAYKLKRAVRYPYMDFSTLEKREAACRAEVTINRRTAPDLYLEARPVRRRPDGTPAFGDAGVVLDWVVVMRRFDQADLLDRMAERGALAVEAMDALGDAVARFHEVAERVPDQRADAMAWVIEDNLSGLRGASAFPADAVERLGAASDALYRRLEPVIGDRRRNGFVRRCHGDLHLRNICLIDGRPTPFDAIEFNDEIAVCDVLYDLAFLVMDLGHRGLRDHANRLLGRYLERTGDYAGLVLFPLYLSQRACVRAKVLVAGAALDPEANRRAATEAEARRYLDRALDYLAPRRPALVAVGGWSGSGKTTVARAIAPGIGHAPGAVVLRSDTIRKMLMGAAETDRLPASGYGRDVTDRVYAALRARAAETLAAGHAVVADAVHGTAAERTAIEAVAAAAGAPFVGLWLEVTRDAATRRVERRSGDASDADAAVVARQFGYDPGPVAWHRIDTAGDPGRSAALARDAVADVV
jgi:aminoglycoside phosphotransferase family enzyme/predicted kinase